MGGPHGIEILHKPLKRVFGCEMACDTCAKNRAPFERGRRNPVVAARDDRISHLGRLDAALAVDKTDHGDWAIVDNHPT